MTTYLFDFIVERLLVSHPSSFKQTQLNHSRKGLWKSGWAIVQLQKAAWMKISCALELATCKVELYLPEPSVISPSHFQTSCNRSSRPARKRNRLGGGLDGHQQLEQTQLMRLRVSRLVLTYESENPIPTKVAFLFWLSSVLEVEHIRTRLVG